MAAAQALEDVRELREELARAEAHPEWGQGPGTNYHRQVEADLEAARRRAGLPILNYTYHGIGYALPFPADQRRMVQRLTGAFAVVQRIGDGRQAVAAIIDNGEGGRWLATELDNLKREHD